MLHNYVSFYKTTSDQTSHSEEFGNFPSTQIIREINFCEFVVSKFAVLASLDFNIGEFFCILSKLKSVKK